MGTELRTGIYLNVYFFYIFIPPTAIKKAGISDISRNFEDILGFRYEEFTRTDPQKLPRQAIQDIRNYVYSSI